MQKKSAADSMTAADVLWPQALNLFDRPLCRTISPSGLQYRSPLSCFIFFFIRITRFSKSDLYVSYYTKYHGTLRKNESNAMILRMLLFSSRIW